MTVIVGQVLVVELRYRGLRLPGAGERDPSRRDGKVGEVEVNRPGPVMLVAVMNVARL